MSSRITKIAKLVLAALALSIGLAAAVFADSPAAELKCSRKYENGNVVVSVEGEAKALYLIYYQTPAAYTVNGQTLSHPEYLQQYIELEKPASEIVISGADPREIHVFDGVDVPEWVHVWEAPCEKADLLLFSSHADDEQLFFAGILPYYSQVRKMQVQVVYATDHDGQPVRHQERLNGLWAVGIRHYPLSRGYADLYSESYDQALANLKPYGIGEAEIIAWEKDMITRFEPQVVVTHDVNGEYGHGMHILVNGTLRKALENASKDFPYLQKVYFHLYEENPVVLSFLDDAFDELGGLTPFQVTQQKGFACHESQHWTWFKRWIWGSKEAITLSKASEIETYSPLYYGCYYNAGKADAEKNDFFEHLLSYDEQAEEAARIAAEEAARIAEEERLAEEARIAAEKQAKKEKIIIGAGAAAVIVLLNLILLLRKPKKGKHSH